MHFILQLIEINDELIAIVASSSFDGCIGSMLLLWQ